MSFIKQKPARETGAALTLAVHALLVLVLFWYHPAAERAQAPTSPLLVSLLPDEEPPTPAVAQPTPPQPSRPAEPGGFGRVVKEVPEPKRAQLETAGGGSPPALDRSLALLPVNVPVLAPGATSGLATGVGSGDDAGEGAGAESPGSGDGRGSGSGSGSGNGSSELQIAEWIVKPEYLVPRYYPREAIEKKATGTVMLGCLVDISNRVRRCKVLDERPRYLGFAAATLRMSKLFRVKPPEVNGRPRHDVRVRIPVTMEYH
jgi:TonB family protein